MGRRKWKYDADTRAMAAEYYCRKKNWTFKECDIQSLLAYPPIQAIESGLKNPTPEQRRIQAAKDILNAKVGE